MFKSKIILCLILLVLLLPVTAISQIIGTERLFGRYQQFVWQDQHGLPQNGISTIVQTPDGYLWMAIAEGVARFDGVRFTAFNTENTPEIKSNNVQSLLVDRYGTLWIGTHGGGLSRYKDGKFSHFSTENGLSAPFIKNLFEDSAGNLWIGTDGGGLNLFKDEKFSAYEVKDGLPDKYVTGISEDSEGNLLVGTTKGLAQFKDGKLSSFTEKNELHKTHINEIFCDKTGNIWISARNGLSRLKDSDFTTFGEADGLKSNKIISIAQDLEETLWFGTSEDGLYRFKDGRFELVTTKEGLINDDIQAIFPDQNGDIWLGTNGGGLAQLRVGQIRTYTTADGLAGNMVNAVFADASGAVWIGTEDGLSRFKDGKFITVNAPDGSSFKHPSVISQDKAGNIWLNSNNAVLKFNEKTSKAEIVNGQTIYDGIDALLEDKAGNIWYGTSDNGLHRIEKGGLKRTFDQKEGLADDYVTVLFEDRDGSIWIGTRKGLSRYKDEKLKTFTASDGWKDSHVLSFHQDEKGTIWIGTHGDGLFRFENGRFSLITAKNGLYDNLAFQILEDDNGNLWMSGNKGIYRANRAELNEFADGQRVSVNSFSYGSSDGMLSRECNSANPAGAKDKDGQLWFPTIKGVVMVNPKVKNEKPPNVAIEKVLIDNKALPNGAEIKLQPSQDDLEIQFTALSWNRPTQIRFKYQLVGLDENWVDSGTRRTAYYPHVSPGEYTFRVIADNGEGVWNTEGQSIKVTVLPPFYRTWWFVALCALALTLTIRLIYLYRIAQLRKIHQAQEEFSQRLIESQENFSRQLIESQEQERKRIAIELHDSVGQSLIVIRNRALMGLNATDKQEKIIAQMEEISESAAETIADVRRISHNLHPYQLEHLGLKTAIETMIEAAENASEIKFETEIDEIDDLLSKESEINLYRIVQESLNNILKHSQATKVKILILKNDDVLSVFISDNGKGFDTGYSFNEPTGLGLTGIRERAKMLGAQHEISSVVGAGTTVSLNLNLN